MNINLMYRSGLNYTRSIESTVSPFRIGGFYNSTLFLKEDITNSNQHVLSLKFDTPQEVETLIGQLHLLKAKFESK